MLVNNLHFNPLPLYRGRQLFCFFKSMDWYFNPLPLYRGRPPWALSVTTSVIFQSTSSIQRKTEKIAEDLENAIFQSTSSIQRKTDCNVQDIVIYIFQSTSSIQRKTPIAAIRIVTFDISIHFLYTEEDTPPELAILVNVYFNPLPLYRGRLSTDSETVSSCAFQSTSSIQRKTSLTPSA